METCSLIQSKLDNPKLAKRPLVYYTYGHPDCVTNAVLLLSAYTMLSSNCSPQEAFAPFESVPGLPLVPFHDATYSDCSFKLSVLDVLCGLYRAASLGWLAPPHFNLEQWEALHEQDTHDMNCVTPKFVAMATPKDKGDEFTGERRVEVHVAILRHLGVTDVVRLNEQVYYRDAEFTEAGMRHHPLEFEDCTTPSGRHVEQFLNICDRARGKVAVHCLAGLGRTGTLIGCHLIKNHGFGAAEAIGYLRLMRPGSVIGPQQTFLHQMERVSWHCNMPFHPPSIAHRGGKAEGLHRLALERGLQQEALDAGGMVGAQTPVSPPAILSPLNGDEGGFVEEGTASGRLLGTDSWGAESCASGAATQVCTPDASRLNSDGSGRAGGSMGGWRSVDSGFADESIRFGELGLDSGGGGGSKAGELAEQVKLGQSRRLVRKRRDSLESVSRSPLNPLTLQKVSPLPGVA